MKLNDKIFLLFARLGIAWSRNREFRLRQIKFGICNWLKMSSVHPDLYRRSNVEIDFSETHILSLRHTLLTLF